MIKCVIDSENDAETPNVAQLQLQYNCNYTVCVSACVSEWVSESTGIYGLWGHKSVL